MKTAKLVILAACVWAGLILACTMSVPTRDATEPFALAAPPQVSPGAAASPAPAWPSPSIGEQLRAALSSRGIRTDGEAAAKQAAPSAKPARPASTVAALPSSRARVSDGKTTGTLVSQLPIVQGDLVPGEAQATTYPTNYKVAKYAVSANAGPAAPGSAAAPASTPRIAPIPTPPSSLVRPPGTGNAGVMNASLPTPASPGGIVPARPPQLNNRFRVQPETRFN